MTAGTNPAFDGKFGGPWTTENLEILEKYLDAYTTALKNKSFKLMYIDAFAGTGEINLRQEDPDARAFIEGSAKRAIKIEDKPFDRLIFVEKDYERHGNLIRLQRENPLRDIQAENSNANSFLRNLDVNWKEWRGVLFLDPFATEVEWATIEKVAQFNALDTWILFPVSAITRMLPKSRLPDDVSRKWANKLTRIFGDDSWRKLYYMRQQRLFGDEQHERDTGTDEIRRIYKDKLKSLFEQRFMKESKVFVNSMNGTVELWLIGGNHEFNQESVGEDGQEWSSKESRTSQWDGLRSGRAS